MKRKITDAELREAVAESDWCSLNPHSMASELLQRRAECRRYRKALREISEAWYPDTVVSQSTIAKKALGIWEDPSAFTRYVTNSKPNNQR